MSNRYINLPVQPYYRLEEVVKAIEGFPPKYGEENGINCISRKLLSKQILSNNAPEYLYKAKGFVPSTSLNDSDRERLSDLLTQLPDISHNMSNEEIENFFEEYYKIPNRPLWEPDITSPHERHRQQQDYDERLKEHCDNFISRVKSGHYHLFETDLTVLRGSKLYPAYAQKHALVSQADTIKFIKHLELNYFLDPSIDNILVTFTQDNASIDCMPVSTKVTENVKASSKRASRRDAITQAIDDFERQYPDNCSPEAMWAHFLEMANKGLYPFLRVVSEEIFWGKTTESSKGLDIKALKGRLHRKSTKKRDQPT
jgi:hypothetical protein